MRLLFFKSSSNTNRKLAFVGAQAFLARYSVTAFSSVPTPIGSSYNHLTTATTSCNSNSNSNAGCRVMIPSSATNVQSRSVGGVSSGSSRSSRSSRLFSSTTGGPTMTNIDKEAMTEIIEDYEEGGREDSGYVVMDVREKNEIEGTGKVSPNTHTLPLSIIQQQSVFEMDDDDFEIYCGFPKPTPDETLVFTCAAGVRSQHACQYAAQGGFTKLVNYKGGAYDWFTGN